MKTFLLFGLCLLIGAGSSFAQQPAAPAPATGSRPMPTVRGDLNGPSWIGHRFYFDRYIGWGWIREEGQKDWKKGRWVIFEETPGVITAPHRYLGNPEADNNYEYRLWGELAPYKGYETNYDMFVDVFVIKGFQVLGPAAPLKLKPPIKATVRGKKTQSSPMSRP